jgi:hypothetical protein
MELGNPRTVVITLTKHLGTGVTGRKEALGSGRRYG